MFFRDFSDLLGILVIAHQHTDCKPVAGDNVAGCQGRHLCFFNFLNEYHSKSLSARSGPPSAVGGVETASRAWLSCHLSFSQHKEPNDEEQKKQSDDAVEEISSLRFEPKMLLFVIILPLIILIISSAQDLISFC